MTRSLIGCLSRVLTREIQSETSGPPLLSCLAGYLQEPQPWCPGMAKAIGTNHGVLDTPAIDAPGRRTHPGSFLPQVTESFMDKQSPAAWATHRSSFRFTFAWPVDPLYRRLFSLWREARRPSGHNCSILRN
jgi:hypothetical protein